MAFANYQDLIDATLSWLNREDQETQGRVADFIVFGENRIFRRLRTRDNEVEVIFDSQVGNNAQGVVLPADFKEVKTVQYDDRMLERKSDQWLLTRDPNAAGGVPQYFARVGNNLRFWRSADANSDVILWYFNQQVHIDASYVPAFYLVAPELYLFGALLEAEPFLKHKDKVPIWQAKYDEVFAAVELEHIAQEYAGSTTTVSSPYTGQNQRAYGNDLTAGGF